MMRRSSFPPSGYRPLAALLSIWLAATASPSARATEATRIYRCQGANGEPVFRDQSCRSAGLERRRRATAPAFAVQSEARQIDTGAALDRSQCHYESPKLRFADPAFDASDARLSVGFDADGPRIAISISGSYVRGDGSEAEVTLDPRIEGQGVQILDGPLLPADARSQENRLEFGRSRSRTMLAAVAQNRIALSIWFSGYQHPVLSESLSGAEIQASADAARRCFQLADRIP
ncbi:MAG: hypothetical protein AB7V26_01165 [Lysobacterales bacterium]